MNKKQLRELIEGAIAYSDELDAQDAVRGRPVIHYQREWERLNSFLISLRADLSIQAPELGKAIADFQSRVINDKNPLIDDAAPAQEKSK